MIFKIKEIFKWRQLIFGLAVNDLKAKYLQATGGFGWMLVMPLIQMAIFTFIFGYLFKIEVKNYPLFLLSGLFSWSFLRSSLDDCANSILSNANLVKKTYFPRHALPISNVIANLITFLFSLIVLIFFSLFYKISFFPGILWLPLIVAIQFILIIGVSLIAAGINSIYRETKFILDIFVLLWFYLTPVVYSLDMARDVMPSNLFRLYALNPMAGIISGYQQIFVYGGIPDINLLLSSAVTSFFICVLGFLIFSKSEDLFMDIL